MDLSDKKQHTPLVTPVGAGLALLCFFMPWVKLSCEGVTMTASGFQLAGRSIFIAIALIAALAILGISLFMWQKQTPRKSKVPVLIAGGIGLGGMLTELIRASAGVETGFGRISMKDIGFSVQFGVFGTILGFIVSIVGVFLIERPELLSSRSQQALEFLQKVASKLPSTTQATLSPAASQTADRVRDVIRHVGSEMSSVASQIAGRVPTNPYLDGIQASLTVIEGPADVNEVYSIIKQESVIGRGGDIKLSEAHMMVSNQHARLTFVGDGQFTLTHLSQTNPTRVNGQHVTESCPLKSGDEIQLGATKLCFEVTQAAPHVASQSAGRVPTAPVLDGVQASLTVIEGPADVNDVFSMTKQESIIGRDGDMKLSDAHQTVSNEHVRLTFVGNGRFTLTHLSRTNPTRVNGRDVTESCPLESGDEIQLGSTKLRFEVKS